MSREKIKRLNSGEAVEFFAEGWYIKKAFFETVDYIVPLDIMDSIKVPVLIVHGDRDPIISVEEVIRAYEKIKNVNEKNELYAVRSVDHTFSKKEHTLEVIKKTLDWIRVLSL